MMGARLLAVMPALLLAGCVHGTQALYGSYVAHGTGGEDLTPPVTLELSRPDRYRFCNGARCTVGRFRLFHLSNPSDGRITFVGPAVEDFSLELAHGTFGESAVDRQRGRRNAIELDYRVGPVGAEITLGAGDAAFVKR